MKTILLSLLAFILVAGSVPAQTKTVHFKKLQDFLPTATLKGLERKKPTGQTQTTMGMTTSEAKVRYVTEQKQEDQPVPEPEEAVEYVSIEVTISDLSGIPFGMMTAMAYQQDFENETEDGYERSVTIKEAYKGKEVVQSGDYKRCELEFIVGNRFMVKLQGSATDDLKLLHTLVGSMDLAKLEKTTP
ncbi:MAG: hypothetical protein HYW57_05800 [Ignavibacteriales bacterium]|nr:hypothetical protein [Ignavibacteriales bacterium]